MQKSRLIAVFHVFAACLLFASLAGATELHRAIRSGDIGYARDLIVNGDPDIIHGTVGRGVTPLHLAAVLNNVEAVELCLSHGADVNVGTEGGFTPLHWAASRDAADTAAHLLESGADINAENNQGVTPLHWAANRNSTNVVALLISRGADILRETATGSTPLHWAVMPDSDSVSAQMLAFEIVGPEVEAEYTNRLQAVQQQHQAELDAIAEAQAAASAEEPPQQDVFVVRDREKARHTLVVDIGLGQKLEFVWIEPLRIWIGKYEITNSQFSRFKTNHDSMFREDHTLNQPLQPVVRVSWHDASEYCDWLNRTYGDRVPKAFHFRLPTAREWMTAARCGQNRIYPWGREWPPTYGNYSDLSARENLVEWRGIEGYDDGHIVSCDVRDSGENDWGIFGLGGNVWEWVSDWFDAEHNYKGRLGGSWDFDQRENLRIDAIGFDRPDARYDTIGFRVVISMHVTQYSLRPPQD